MVNLLVQFLTMTHSTPQISIGIFLIACCLTFQGHAQNIDSLQEKESKMVKKGWTFGALPVISYDTDIGFQYGLLANFFNYGNGETYPEYLQSIYLEWSRTTKGSGINRFYFDSEHIIPGIRTTADVSYLTEQAMQFFGFNGYDAVYNANWEKDDHEDYISRMFYRHDRKMFRVMMSFQGNILKNNDQLRWVAGFTYFGNKIAPVDIDRLNKGKDEDEKLPDVEGLYDKYVRWGILENDEATGNKMTYLKGGIAFDNRDFEAFPTEGIWAEAIYSFAPTFLGDGKYSYSKLTLWWRHYLNLLNKNLIFAYRLGYQGTVSGRVPFHMQPHIVPTIMTAATSQGLGGSKSLRGIMRNRVVGDGIVLGNAELRWKFLNTQVFKQQLYLGTNLFVDVGRVVDKIETISEEEFNAIESEENYADYFAPGTEDFHISSGAGLKVGLNENFVLSLDYGLALDDRDGRSGFYITLNWLY